MTLRGNLITHLMERCGGIVDIKENPEIIDEIVNKVVTHLEANKESAPSATAGTTPPFDVSWMDSWVAHHVLAERITDLKSKNQAVASVLQGMVDARFNARLAEIRDAVLRVRDEPPDGGTPEPGVPPPPDPGPARARFFDEPPDGGTPEPGVPPPPDPSPGRAAIFDEPPDGGPPEPGTPPAGPQGSDFGSFAENPWILYWFVSLKAPMLLNVIDLHISRRLESLQKR